MVPLDTLQSLNKVVHGKLIVDASYSISFDQFLMSKISLGNLGCQIEWGRRIQNMKTKLNEEICPIQNQMSK